MIRRILITIMALLPAAVYAQEIGANFNHDPEIIDLAYLRKTPVEWIRTTPYIFEYIRGEKDPATEPGLQKVVDAAKAGYKVAFGFRWDFRKHRLRIPQPGSAEEKKYFATATAILERVGPYADLFKLGNEPNLETMEPDLQVNAEGVVPLVRFTDFVDIVNRGKKLARSKPNIIILYADDLGYGDLGCYGASAVKTPNIDRLAARGTGFTDAHSTAATCTPSRVSLLTGAYAFRNNAAILPGDAPLLIRPGTVTLPGILQQAGYTTAVVGKWHLGLSSGSINWNEHIAPGPNEIGFDYSFIIPATTDRVPTVFVENGRVPNLEANDPIAVSYAQKIGNEPTGLSDPQLLKQQADTQHSNTIINGISRIGFMTGGKRARWVDEDIPLVLNGKAKDFVIRHSNRPFFLYYPFPNIHVPRTPNRRFAGATKLGPRGDVIAEMDWMAGEIMQLLDSLGIAKNTLIIFSSDNGPVLGDGYEDLAEKLNDDHQPGGIFRGGKYSAFEAGTRVSAITYWPGVIQSGVSAALCSQVDLLASLAALAGRPLPPGTAQDSHNMLDAWLGRSTQGRKYLLEESYTLSLRKDAWKYIAPQQKPAPEWLKNKKIETGLESVPQLYDLQRDPREAHNLADQHPEIVKALKQELEILIL